MSAETKVLGDEIKRSLRVLGGIESRLRRFIGEELSRLGRSEIGAVFVGRLVTSYYTALETLLLRISQFFENSLSKDRWHADLLDKMCLRITGIREAAISRETVALLRELLRFRHFERYYFELEYDWKKLDYVVDVLERVHPLLLRDLDGFGAFLRLLDGDAAGERP
jgi:hypothetical protein